MRLADRSASVVTVASSSPVLFALPGLTWAPDDLRALKPPAGADPPALGAWSELGSLELALLALDPRMRANASVSDTRLRDRLLLHDVVAEGRADATMSQAAALKMEERLDSWLAQPVT